MKKILLAILSLLLALTIFGCDGGGGGNSENQKLLQTLQANSWFCDDEQSLYVRFDAEKNGVEQTISHTSYYLWGDITDIRKTSENHYEIDLHHDARHDEEMDYDEYTGTVKMVYDTGNPTVLTVIFINGSDEDGPHELHTDKGLNEDEILKLLQDNGPYLDSEHNNCAVFNAKSRTLADRRIANYDTPQEETVAIKSIVYKGFNYYDINLDVEGQMITLPICFDKDAPDCFYTLTEEPAFYATDIGMDAAKLLDWLVGGNIYEDEYHDISVIFDNSMGHIIVKNKPDNLSGEFGILKLDYLGCDHYIYLVEDEKSGINYNIYLRIYRDGSKIAIRFMEYNISDHGLYAGN
ncbi:MAG: hypothetical protein IJM79_00925 [Erysipelotrichaceae bacterium]|nr:hypothetical protein [Erysipelotrichaceae bacterium]